MPGDTKGLLGSFVEKENEKLRVIQSYVYDARSNYVQLHREALDGMRMNGALDWAANNSGVRVAALEQIVGALEAQLPELRSQFPTVSSVLVSANQWTTDFGGPHRDVVTAIRGKLTTLFRGLHYVGTIEPAYYPRRQIDGFVRKGVVGWHAHLVFWHGHRDRLQRIIKAFNESTEGPLYSVPPASIMRRSWKTAPNCFSYFLKMPAKSYSTRRIAERIDPHTGEIFPEHDRQNSQKLRPGEHVHMRNVLGLFTLDDLLMSGGSGHELLAPMHGKMLRDRCRYQQRGRPLSRFPSQMPISVARSCNITLR